MTEQPIPVSCTIIAKNEGDRIARTIASVEGLVDEVVVVDSGSTDNTVQECERMHAKVVHNDWPGYGPQKRFAEDQASHGWILNLDADEVLTSELREEIANWRGAGKPLFDGYRFHQTTVYPGERRPRPFADFHNYVRLYDRRAMRFHESLVHDTVDTAGKKVGQFKGDCWHWSFRSLEHLERKLDGYTTLQAREIKKPVGQLRRRKPFEYWILLFRYVFLKRHITGGWYGLKVAHTIAKGRAARISKFLAHAEEIV